MPRQFDPEKHCGAKTSNGSPCLNSSGFRTDHPGSGRCHLHGGCSTGPRSPEGKGRSAQNARRHGLYARVLTGNDAIRFKAVQDFEAADILNENFYLVQSRMLGILEGEARYDRQSEKLLQACEILIENGELDEDYVKELRLKLLNIDVGRMAQIFNSSVNLANASTFLNRMGDIRKQLDLAKNFMIRVVRMTEDREIRELAIATISEMKLEAGLPVEELSEFLRLAQEADEAKQMVEEAEHYEAIAS